jgi:hypothetical protein
MAQSTHTLYRCDSIRFYDPDSSVMVCTSLTIRLYGLRRLSLVSIMAFHSKHDRLIRKFVPSVARLSYNPFFKIAGDAIARALALPFPEFRDLPPNHLCVRIGCGNRIFNSHVMFIKTSGECWLNFLSRNYCKSSSDVVELGCGCGRIARALRDPWFEGTYVGVDVPVQLTQVH